MASLPENDRLSGPFTAVADQVAFDSNWPLIDAPGDPAGTCVVMRRIRDGETEDLTLGDFTITASTDTAFTATLAEGAEAGDVYWMFGRQRQARLRAHPEGGAVRTPILEGDAREAAARDQEARRDLDRSVLAPLGEAGLSLPAEAGRTGGIAWFGSATQIHSVTLTPGQFLASDADGNPVSASGTGADAGLREDMAAAAGGTLIGWLRQAAGAQFISVADKFEAGLVNVLEFIPLSIRNNLITGASTPDVTAYVQLAAAAAVAMKRGLYLPGVLSEYKLTSPIAVSGKLSVWGDGPGATRLLCVDCDGFTFSAGSSDFYAENFKIALASRYTTTPNTRVAFRVAGTALAPCYEHHYRRVVIDGFQYGLLGDFISQSSFDITTVYVFCGIWVRGQSVNNVVMPTAQIAGVDSIFTAAPTNSTGIRVGDGTAPQPEGFTIAPGALIFGFKRALRNHGAINVTMTGVICDGISEFLLLHQSNDAAPAMNCNYSDNYGGITGACDTAYYLTSSATAYRNDDRGTTLRNNELCIYGTASLLTGYYVEGAFIENINIVDNKKIRGKANDGSLILTTVRDCKIGGGRNHRISRNVWNDTTGFETLVPVWYEDNAGRLAVGADLCSRAGTVIGSGVWNPGSLADATGETSPSVTCSGAAVGDFVEVAPPYDLQGLVCTGWVSATDTVKIRLHNSTGAPVDLASGTWRVAAKRVA